MSSLEQKAISLRDELAQLNASLVDVTSDAAHNSKNEDYYPIKIRSIILILRLLVKVVHHEPFTSGLQVSDTPPFGGETLKYQGKYYTLSGKRIPYQRDKTKDERFFILTLFAIAYEIQAVGGYSRNIMRVQLAVGLPPAHYGAQHKAFTSYFTDRGVIQFDFQVRSYSIYVEKVMCFPQAYAAAATILQSLRDKPRALVVDQGGMTTDILLLKEGAGDLSVCESLENGVITMYNQIRSRVNAELDILVEESEYRRHFQRPKGPCAAGGGRHGGAAGPGVCQRPVQHPAGARAGDAVRCGGVCGRRSHPASPADRGIWEGSYSRIRGRYPGQRKGV